MSKTVFYIKLIHWVLFCLIIVSTIYVFVTAAINQINTLTWWAFAIAVIELLALLLNSWRCPLTELAEQHGAEVVLRSFIYRLWSILYNNLSFIDMESVLLG